MKKCNLQAIDLNISEGKLEKIFKIVENQYQSSSMWHAGGALGNRVAVRKINFWDVDHICVSGFFSSSHHMKVNLSTAKGSTCLIDVKSSPHYRLAKYIVDNYRGDEVNCEEVCLPVCAKNYIKYIADSSPCEMREAREKLQYFVNLISSISRDMQSLQPWRGEIVCINGQDPCSLMVLDGFHRFSVLAALGYEVIPTAMYIGLAEKLMSPSW